MVKENGEKTSQLLDSILQEYQSGNLHLENENYTYDQLTEVLRSLRKKMKFYSAQKNKFQNENDSEKLDNVRGILRGYKHIASRLMDIKEQKEIEMISKQKKEVKKEKHEISVWEYLTQVGLLDATNHHSIEILFQEYEQAKDSDNKIDILYKIKSALEDLCNLIYEKEEEIIVSFVVEFNANHKNNIKVNDKKRIKTYLQEEQYQAFKDALESLQIADKKMQLVLEKVRNLIGKEKNICARKERDELRTVSIASNQEVLKQLELAQKDSLYEMLNCIQLIDIDKPENIRNTYEKSVSLFNCLESKEEDLRIFLDIIDRYIKIKITQVENSSLDEKEEIRRELKKLQKLYQDKKNNWFGKKIRHAKDYYNYCSDILCTLMGNDQNYYYIKRIITENKSILSDVAVQSIVLPYTLDCFIKNSKRKIASQGLSYINPEYYLKLMQLFLQNCDHLQSDVEEFLRARLNVLYLSITGKEREENSDVNVDSMNLSNIKKETLYDIDTIEKQLNQVNNESQLQENEFSKKLQIILSDYIEYFRKEKNVENLSSSFTLNNQIAYTISYTEKGDMLFKVHLLDTSSAFNEHMNLDERMKQLEIAGKNVKTIYPFANKGIYPVFTFHFKIFNNNLIAPMKLYKETIRIDNQYSQKQMRAYRSYPDLKNYVSAMNRFKMGDSEFDIECSEQWILQKISQEIIGILESKEIPFIYQRPVVLAIQALQEKNHNDVCDLLHEIDKPLAHKIFNILEEKPETVYTNYPIDEASVSLDGFTYTGLLLQRVLSKIHNSSNACISTEKDMLILCKELNERFGYVSNTFFKEKKRIKDNKKTYTEN